MTITGAYVVAQVSAAHLLTYLHQHTPFVVIVDYYDEAAAYRTREQRFASPAMAAAYAQHLLSHRHPEVVSALVAYRFG